MAKTIWSSCATIALITLLTVMVVPTNAQHQLGAFGGFNRGLNEGSVGTQALSPSAGIGLLFDHLPTSTFSVELQLFASRIGTETFTMPNDYQTSLLTIQFVGRYNLLQKTSGIKPFIGTGLGFTFYNNDSIPKNLPSSFRSFSGISLSFPIFVGTTIPLSEAFDLDLQTGAIVSTNDQLHPIQDGTNDAWIYMRLGVYCAFSKLIE